MPYAFDVSATPVPPRPASRAAGYSPWQIRADARREAALQARATGSPAFPRYLRLVRDLPEQPDRAASPPARDQSSAQLSPASVSLSPRPTTATSIEPAANGTGIASTFSASDPRWVLAVQTSRALQGTLLPQQDRERLMRWGQQWGLSAFSCSLILAIVQDQARRGLQPELCPAAGAAQLHLVPAPDSARRRLPRHRLLGAWCLIGLLALECLAVYWWLIR